MTLGDNFIERVTIAQGSPSHPLLTELTDITVFLVQDPQGWQQREDDIRDKIKSTTKVVDICYEGGGQPYIGGWRVSRPLLLVSKSEHEDPEKFLLPEHNYREGDVILINSSRINDIDNWPEVRDRLQTRISKHLDSDIFILDFKDEEELRQRIGEINDKQGRFRQYFNDAEISKDRSQNVLRIRSLHILSPPSSVDWSTVPLEAGFSMCMDTEPSGRPISIVSVEGIIRNFTPLTLGFFLTLVTNHIAANMYSSLPIDIPLLRTIRYHGALSTVHPNSGTARGSNIIFTATEFRILENLVPKSSTRNLLNWWESMDMPQGQSRLADFINDFEYKRTGMSPLRPSGHPLRHYWEEERNVRRRFVQFLSELSGLPVPRPNGGSYEQPHNDAWNWWDIYDEENQRGDGRRQQIEQSIEELYENGEDLRERICNLEYHRPEFLMQPRLWLRRFQFYRVTHSEFKEMYHLATATMHIGTHGGPPRDKDEFLDRFEEQTGFIISDISLNTMYHSINEFCKTVAKFLIPADEGSFLYRRYGIRSKENLGVV